MVEENSISQNQPLAENDILDTAWEETEAAKSLRRMQQNPRVKYIVINAPRDACPLCQNLTGTYPKDQVPRIPHPLCSNPDGCKVFYSPYLDDIYP